eukprot:Gregarina_sp_Poly_1__10203@NODE_705_length_6682_cov_51_577627_g532_i0_p1_GENE_NODE_705_length_6682_cov_51_577627_g532_i0NODE_705_length_6682_cov_51_577627_g532_i0_p1_ORF_typecomplete_len211_score28_00SAS4/PF15460_6/0_00016_NODE_705_length_6682_cov_51_577627_g532_i044525084
MKGIQTRLEPSPSSDILSNALISCSQILIGNKQWAIECQSSSKPMQGLGICEHLRNYKIASFKPNFVWYVDEFIRLIYRSECEQGKIEKERTTHNEQRRTEAIEKFASNDWQRLLTIRMKAQKLQVVEHKNYDEFEAACTDLLKTWDYWATFPDATAVDQLLGYSAKEHRNRRVSFASFSCVRPRTGISETFIKYHMLFLRKRQNEEQST